MKQGKKKSPVPNEPEEHSPVPEGGIAEDVAVPDGGVDLFEPEDESNEPDTEREENEVARLERELTEERDRCLRLAAEYDNYRKRSQKERESIYADVRADTISRLLPVYDNLERAAASPSGDEAYQKGIGMILSQLDEELSKLGVTPIAALGEVFDPTRHEAVMHEDDPEKGEGEVVEVFRRGFILGDKVIRPSLVKVAN